MERSLGPNHSLFQLAKAPRILVHFNNSLPPTSDWGEMLEVFAS